MNLNELKPAIGSMHKEKRIGRGAGSGHGKTATKGHKGQKARSGGSIKAGFEGGQMPLQRRLPKRGFTPLRRNLHEIVNICQLEVFENGDVITNVILYSRGLISNSLLPVKILGNGNLTKTISVSVSKVSSAAKEKIVAAGGTVEEHCGA